jgi:hypothetical protein
MGGLFRRTYDFRKFGQTDRYRDVVLTSFQPARFPIANCRLASRRKWPIQLQSSEFTKGKGHEEHQLVMACLPTAY